MPNQNNTDLSRGASANAASRSWAAEAGFTHPLLHPTSKLGPVILINPGTRANGVFLTNTVVTILFRYSLNALKAFLDLPADKVFYYVWRSGYPQISNICIARKGETVTIGAYKATPSELGHTTVEWDGLVRYDIRESGEWIGRYRQTNALGDLSDIFSPPKEHPFRLQAMLHAGMVTESYSTELRSLSARLSRFMIERRAWRRNEQEWKSVIVCELLDVGECPLFFY